MRTTSSSFSWYSQHSSLPSSKYLMSNDAGSSLGKKKPPFPCSEHTPDLLHRLKNQSQFCCLLLQQGQLSTRIYTKAVDLFHRPVSQVPRTMADLGWQGNNSYTTPSLITLGCQFSSCQVYQKQHKMFATVRLRKALLQSAEHYEKCLGLT